MASRSWSSQSTVLTLSPFGENHREASVLTEDRGLIKAAVFGGAKSKLRSTVAPYHSGRMWFYSDPVKKTNKITDFDVNTWREHIRENLVKTWCAALCTEIVLRSQGVCDWILVNGFFDGINASGEAGCKTAVIRFLWRTVCAAGLRVDIEKCARCGADYSGSRQNNVLWYVPGEDGCVCADCSGAEERFLPLSDEGRRYLHAVESREPNVSRSMPLSPHAYTQLRDFLFFVTAGMLGGKLKTVDAGAGVL